MPSSAAPPPAPPDALSTDPREDHDSLVVATRELLNTGRPFAAFDTCRRAQQRFPASRILAQLSAQTLIQTGALREAAVLLEALCADGCSEESMGLLGRSYKDLWKRTGDQTYLVKSRDTYVKGFRVNRGIYAGINAATMSLLLGEKVVAWALAQEVLDTCDDPPTEGDVPQDPYWPAATRAEALLVLGRPNESIAAYEQAAELARGRFGMIGSSLHQLHLLQDSGNEVPKELFEIIRPPTVLAFAGHMLDAYRRDRPRFPPAIESAVADAIGAEVRRLGAGIAYCSAACGADILFAEAMIDQGGQVNIILPFNLRDFVETSVRHGGSPWITRMHEVLGRATTVRYVTEEPHLRDDVLFEFANAVIRGLAQMRATTLGSEARLLAVWDGNEDDRPGGTGRSVKDWPEDRRDLINLETIRAAEWEPTEVEFERSGDTVYNYQVPAPEISDRVIRSLLFADIVGYSKLQEEATPTFVRRFLEHVALVLRNQDTTPEFVNTWGDAIFAVTKTPSELAAYAFALRQAVTEPNWGELGLPDQITLRMALHAGPVFEHQDPLTRRLNYYGSHVNRAARLEPISVPGCVYASEQFAAALRAEQREAMAYDLTYVGLIDLPKKFGAQRMYNLTRKSQ